MYGLANSRLVLGDQALAFRDRVVGGGDRILEDDAHRAIGAHHRDLRGRPGEVHVAADVLAAHDVVGAAVGLARDDRDLRDGGLAVGVQQLRAVLDDPAVLLADARQEARDIDERDDRDVEAIAGADETRGLDRRIDVERTGENGGLLRDDADAPPAEAREPDDDVRGPARLDLEERAVVGDALDDVVHVVRPRRIVGDDRVQRPGPCDRSDRASRPAADRTGCSAAGATAVGERRRAPRTRPSPPGARHRSSSCASSRRRGIRNRPLRGSRSSRRWDRSRTCSSSAPP